ncbi:alpha-1,2-fucosyltransferase [bacterium]|nr:MAG: alpha-1,2-fucosyltransferase [bacterium]
MEKRNNFSISMIIVKLMGGIGNQMFQYAMGRCLSLRKEEKMKLDKTGFETDELREYNLNHFNIVESFATAEEKKPFKKYQRKPGKMWYWYNHTIADSSKYAIDELFYFQPNILQLKGPVYLDGYWQTEKYFKEYEDIIRQDFTLKKEPTGKDMEIAKQILETNAVSVHVRRSDYVSNPVNANYFGTFGPEYYREAERIISKKIANPHFFVFSDDAEWVKKNIFFKSKTTYVNHNDASKNYADLWLMSLCKHHIIPNSSFGWWGAWLNRNPNKIVIAPKKWIQKPSVNTKDVIPDSWITI